jgi:anti-sigma B factor antagonist
LEKILITYLRGVKFIFTPNNNSMKFTVDKKERYCIFKLVEPKLDSIISANLKSELVILNQEGFRNIICDLSDVNFIDSSGLSALLIGHRLCKESNGTFVLTGCGESTVKLIKISQLDTILNVVPTESEATDFILMEEIEREIGEE